MSSATLLPSPPISKFSNFKSLNPRIFPSNSSPIPTKITYKSSTNLPANRFLRFSSLNFPPSNEDTPSFIETREAISMILQEFGVSKEESDEIALKSPKYVRMVVDGVCDLDQLSLWKSWTDENQDFDKLSFKHKALYIAKQKGDNGMLPFLESIGLNPSSSTHIARYLRSESLPQLIQKVKYVKDMIYTGGDDDERTGKNARRMMTQLSVFVDENVQQTLSFFEKMEARRGGLKMLGSKDASFQYLIESFPRLLLLSVENHLEPLRKYLEGVGVPVGRVGVIILLFPPIIFWDIDKDIKPRLCAIEQLGADERDIGKMLLKYPWILSTSIQENYKDILLLFELEKVPKASVDRAIKSWPHILGCSTTKLKLMIEELGEFGIKTNKLGHLISSSPQLLLRKPNELLQVVIFMKELGLDKETIEKILSRRPQIFAASIENTLKKKLSPLIDLGISQNQLPRVIKKYPEILVSDINTTIRPRMEYLKGNGLSKTQVGSMVCRFSPLLGYSIEEVLKPKLDFLINTMGKPVNDVVDYPRYFSYSLEKKIKPRFWVLKGRSVECSLKDMLGKNDEDFAADYMGVERLLVPPPSSGQ
ncbi:hypothetical protein ACHQM5_030547 [Ranunculus cassubicifolius]